MWPLNFLMTVGLYARLQSVAEANLKKWKGKDKDLYWSLYSVKHFNLNKVEVKQTSIFDI